jgi:hypothetical protein
MGWVQAIVISLALPLKLLLFLVVYWLLKENGLMFYFYIMQQKFKKHMKVDWSAFEQELSGKEKIASKKSKKGKKDKKNGGEEPLADLGGVNPAV